MTVLAPPDPLSLEFAADPYLFFPLLREAFPVLYVPAVDGYFVSRYDDVCSVLHDPRFTTAPLAVRAEPVMRGRVLAQMAGREHTTKRRIVIRDIVGNSLSERFAPMIRADARELITPHLAGGRVDLVGDFGRQLAVHVTLDLLGLPKSDWEDVARWHAGVADFITGVMMTPERRDHSLWCSEQLARYLTPIIEQRAVAPREDYLSTLCTAEVDGVRMTTTDVLALCLNVLLAATEPADKTLALLFRHLIEHPDQMRRVRQDRSLLPKAIAETLRVTPPVQLIPREAAEDVVLGGSVVPAGSTVFCMIGAANHDPSAFDEPGSFDIDRDDLDVARSFSAAAAHLAFGTGMHYCVGAAFARVEIQEVADLLLDLMEDIRFAPGFRYRESGLYTRGPVSLELEFRAASGSGT